MTIPAGLNNQDSNVITTLNLQTTGSSSSSSSSSGNNNIPDFAALLSKNKNYRPAGVSQIVPRDAYRRRERKNNNSNNKEKKTEDERKESNGTINGVVSSSKSSWNNGNANNGNTAGGRGIVVYKVDEDGITCVPEDRVDAIINGEETESSDDSDSCNAKHCDYYIVGGEEEDNFHNSLSGYTRQEYLLEKALASAMNTSSYGGVPRANFIEYLQNDDTVKSTDQPKSQDGTETEQPQMGTLLVSKTPLLLQDKIDIQATAEDAIKSQEASKLAYQLSLRTSACSTTLNHTTEASESTPSKSTLALFEPITSSNDAAKIVISTMSEKERIQLEEKRKREEATLPYHLHGIELQGWESKINWEGAGGDPEDVAKGASNTKGNAMAVIDTSYPDPKEILSQPFNTSFEGMDLSKLISWEGADAKPGFNEALGRQLGKLVLQDTVVASSVVKTSGAIPNSNPKPFNQSEEYKNRMESKNSGLPSGPISSLQSDMMKKNKEIEARQRRRAKREFDKKQRITAAMNSHGALAGGTGRAITSSLMGPGGTERTGRPMRHHGSSLAHDFEYIEQLDMINNHSLVKADLSPIELRHYSRPLLRKTLFRQRDMIQWQLQLIVTPNKKSLNGKRGGGSTYNSMVNVMPGSISQSKMRNYSDLCPSEGSLVLIEYCEEKPPMKLMKGMASKIVNYYKGDKSKCPVSAGGGDLPTKKKKHGLTNQDSDIKGSSGKVEKPPRLEGPDFAALNTKDLIGKIGHKKNGDKNNDVSSSITKLPEGVTEILKDSGPFLGKVMDGTTQTGIVNNLFVAPMYRHDPKPTDFLLILGKSRYQSGGLGVILRSMPKNIFTAGQTEPKRKVYAPDSKGDKDFVTPFTTYQIAKALHSKQAKERCGLKFEEIKDGLFPYTEIPTNPLRQRIKKVAAYDKNTQIWTLKLTGVDDFDGIESLSRGFTPEGVAAYWRYVD